MNQRTSRYRSALRTPIQLAVISLVASTGASFAQTTEPAAAEGNKLPTVLVTATKKATSLQKTPVAVTAINATTLEDNHVQTLLDVFSLVPSFQGTSQGDHGIVSMTLRGIGNDSAKTEYADPEVALFVDGVFSPRPEGAATMLFDLDGVEVLRGPQGTLWGRNSTVGAVNFKTAKPVLKDQSGYFEGGVGSFSRIGTRGAVNLPVSDTVAMRVAFVHEQHDGYVDFQNAPNPSLASQKIAYAAANNGSLDGFAPINRGLFVNSGPKYNAQDQTAARFSLLVKPSADIRWDLSLEQFRDRGTPSMSLMQTPRAGEKFWSALIDTAPSLKRDATNVRSRFELDLGGQTLTYVAGINRFTGSGTYDQDLGVGVPTSIISGAGYQADNTVWSKYHSQSHELTLQSNGQQELDWILGLYYGAEDNGIRFDIPIFNGTQQGTVGWQASFIQPKETVTSKAVFGQLTYNPSKDLHLTAGARYTSDDRKNIGGGSWAWQYKATEPQIPISNSTDPKNDPGYAQGDHNDGHYTGNKATWLARANYDLSKDAMVYGSVSTGYKSGGLQDGGDHYGPETLTSYEAGLKQTLLDGSLTVNLAAYHIDFKGYQFAGPIQRPDGSRAFGFANAEGAKVSGLELELAARLSENDRVGFTATYTTTKLSKLLAFSRDYTLPDCTDPIGKLASTTCLDVTGNQMPHAPKLALQFNYEHVVRLGDGNTLSPRIALTHNTKQYLSVFNFAGGDEQKAYTKVDLGLRYASKKNWYVDAFVRNAGDEKIKTGAGSAGTFAAPIWTAQYAAPRTYGINAGYNF